MADDVKDLIAVLNSLANVHGSIADSKLATERYKQSLKDNKEMKLLSAELTNKNSQNVFMRNQLDKALTNSISDITKTHNKIQGLGIDYQNYITEIPEELRTDDMLAIFEDDWDGSVKEHSMNIRTGSDIFEVQQNMQGSIDYTNALNESLKTLIVEHEQGKLEGDKLQHHEAGIKGIVDYADYVQMVKDNPEKFQVLNLGPDDEWTGMSITGAGIDGILGNDDDETFPLSPAGMGLISKAPTFKQQLSLQRSLQLLETGEAVKRKKEIEQQSLAEQSFWEQSDESLRLQQDIIEGIGLNVTNNEAYLGQSTFHAGRKGDKKIFNDKQSLKMFQDNLSNEIVSLFNWGYDESKLFAYDDALSDIIDSNETNKQKVIALYDALIPKSTTKIDPQTGMNKDFLKNIDFGGFGKLDPKGQKDFIEKIKLYKMGNDILNKYDTEFGNVTSTTSQSTTSQSTTTPTTTTVSTGPTTTSPSQFNYTTNDLNQLDSIAVDMDLPSIYLPSGQIDYDAVDEVLLAMQLQNID